MANRDKADPASVWDSLLLTVLLWGWAIPGAYFWQLAKSRDILLPHAPRLVWLLPGEIWRLAPAVLISILVLLPLAYYSYIRKNPSFLRFRRSVFVVLFSLIILINLLWGSALQ